MFDFLHFELIKKVFKISSEIPIMRGESRRQIISLNNPLQDFPFIK